MKLKLCQPYVQGVSKKPEHIGNRSQFCKAATDMMFLVPMDCFGTYDVEL